MNKKAIMLCFSILSVAHAVDSTVETIRNRAIQNYSSLVTAQFEYTSTPVDKQCNDPYFKATCLYDFSTNSYVTSKIWDDDKSKKTLHRETRYGSGDNVYILYGAVPRTDDFNIELPYENAKCTIIKFESLDASNPVLSPFYVGDSQSICKVLSIPAVILNSKITNDNLMEVGVTPDMSIFINNDGTIKRKTINIKDGPFISYDYLEYKMINNHAIPVLIEERLKFDAIKLNRHNLIRVNVNSIGLNNEPPVDMLTPKIPAGIRVMNSITGERYIQSRVVNDVEINKLKCELDEVFKKAKKINDE